MRDYLLAANQEKTLMTATACPTNNQLKALSLGQLPEEQSDDLFAHIRNCDSCKSELETVGDSEDSLIASLRSPNEFIQLEAEPACQMALAKALGALTRHQTEVPAVDPDHIPAQSIGEYIIVRPLGRGGMGSVFLAQHTKLGRQVALKILNSHRLGDPRMRERFESEMRAVGKLSHPNIVTAHDARDVDGTLVLVTEFIDGFDLGELIARTGPLSIADACELARLVAVALAYTSEQGFVHRDVKPSNIMLSNTGEVKLLDLGLARLQAGSGDQLDITGTGQAMGTADYIAPEQVADSRSVDVRADIYALGCTLFKLLTAHAPFADDQHVTAFAKMTAHVSQPPPRLSDFLPDAPLDLVRLVASMLAKPVENRPQQPRMVAEQLAAFTSGANLQQLAHRAAKLQIVPAAVRPPSSTGSASTTKTFWKRPVSKATAIATGFLGMLFGVCLGIIITITNPDGTKTIMKLAEGSKLEISESGINAGGQAHAKHYQQLPISPNFIEWMPYSEAELERLRGTGKTVVLLFTARWNLTGQQLVKSIESLELTRQVSESGVKFMLADWTEPSDAIQAKLDELNQKSVPLLAIYEGEPGLGPKILSDPQSSEVIRELQNLLQRQRREANLQQVDDLAETTSSHVPPLQFALLVNPESTGKVPSITNDELLKLFRLPISEKPTGEERWLPIGESTLSDLPIERLDDLGQRYALVSSDPDFSISWDEISGHILELNVRGKSKNQNAELEMKFDQTLGASMLKLTAGRNLQMLAIIVGDKILSTPMINSPISSKVMIAGMFSDAELNRLRTGLASAQLASSNDLNITSGPQKESVDATGKEDARPGVSNKPQMKLSAIPRYDNSHIASALHFVLEEIVVQQVAPKNLDLGKALIDLNASALSDEAREYVTRLFASAWPMDSLIYVAPGLPEGLSHEQAFVAYRLDMVPSELMDDLNRVAEAMSGTPRVFEDGVEGMAKDPNGPRVRLNEDLIDELSGKFIFAFIGLGKRITDVRMGFEIDGSEQQALEVADKLRAGDPVLGVYGRYVLTGGGWLTKYKVRH